MVNKFGFFRIVAQRKLAFYSVLPTHQQISLVSLVLFLVFLPFGVLGMVEARQPLRTYANATSGNQYTVVPKFSTSTLATAKVGVPYNAIIGAWHKAGSVMEMIFTNLPQGISMGKCYSSVEPNGQSNYLCELAGIPVSGGEFAIKATVIDNKSNRTDKTFVLKILP